MVKKLSIGDLRHADAALQAADWMEAYRRYSMLYNGSEDNANVHVGLGFALYKQTGLRKLRDTLQTHVYAVQSRTGRCFISIACSKLTLSSRPEFFINVWLVNTQKRVR